jgi:hypothetical protein
MRRFMFAGADPVTIRRHRPILTISRILVTTRSNQNPLGWFDSDGSFSPGIRPPVVFSVLTAHQSGIISQPINVS